MITASCSDRWGSFYVQFMSAPTVSCASYLDLFLDLCSDAFFKMSLSMGNRQLDGQIDGLKMV